MDMEVDMVADGVNDMEVYKIADEVAGMDIEVDKAVDELDNMVVDIEVVNVSGGELDIRLVDMEVDKVTDEVADEVADMVVDTEVDKASRQGG